jgi:hypothetical protein
VDVFIAVVVTRRAVLMVYIHGGGFALSSGLTTSRQLRARVNRVVAVQTNIGSCNDVIGSSIMTLSWWLLRSACGCWHLAEERGRHHSKEELHLGREN